MKKATETQMKGKLQAVTIVTNSWVQSIRFYTEALGYFLLERGELTLVQKEIFGRHLGKYALLGHEDGAVIRLIETSHAGALPNRIGAHPWDTGLACMEATTPDLEKAYWKVLRARFGAIVSPSEKGYFNQDVRSNRHATFIGPSGEQLIVNEKKQKLAFNSSFLCRDGVEAPFNTLVALPSKEHIKLYDQVLGFAPATHFNPSFVPELVNAEAAVMDEEYAGSYRTPHDLSLDPVCVSSTQYQSFPCDFFKTGIASACWKGTYTDSLSLKLQEVGWDILSEVGLPIRHNPEPAAVVFRGPVGEILEMLS